MSHDEQKGVWGRWLPLVTVLYYYFNFNICHVGTDISADEKSFDPSQISISTLSLLNFCDGFTCLSI